MFSGRANVSWLAWPMMDYTMDQTLTISNYDYEMMARKKSWRYGQRNRGFFLFGLCCWGHGHRKHISSAPSHVCSLSLSPTRPSTIDFTIDFTINLTIYLTFYLAFYRTHLHDGANPTEPSEPL